MAFKLLQLSAKKPNNPSPVAKWQGSPSTEGRDDDAGKVQAGEHPE